jgi:DNA-binding MarR family transcriptional regulator
LFADPAWDMLLDLFVAKGEGRSISVSSLCIAAGVPASTAHRWIQALVRAGTVRRRADPLDRRRVYVEITEHAFAAMATELLRHRDRMVEPCS